MILFHFSGKYFRDKMERVLFRGLKFVFSDYESSYNELLAKANMDSLELTRTKCIIQEIYKFFNGVGPEYIGDIFEIACRNSRRGSLLKVVRCRTTVHGLHSLRSLGPRLWNNLDASIKNSSTVTTLKNNLKEYEGITCHCAMCRS